jgi:DNA-binding CsgD family transcriptional regulator
MLDRYGTRVLSAREKRLIALVARGLKNGEAAEIMGVTEHVFKNYLRAVYDKLGFGNRLELALWHEARRQEAEKGEVEESPLPKKTEQTLA